LSSADVQPPPGLPEPLPDGERILWQRSPRWRPFARRVFHVNKLALYFAVLVAWIALAAAAGDGGLPAALRAMAWSLPPALAALAILGALGWMYARSTIFTVTDQRIVIQSGLAFPAAINLPFSQVERADLRTHADGTGDIELTLSGPRVLYSMLWPNLRMLRISQPSPLLRALERPQEAAEALAGALASHQQVDAAQHRASATERRPATA
jgi:hypothetical protein